MQKPKNYTQVNSLVLDIYNITDTNKNISDLVKQSKHLVETLSKNYFYKNLTLQLDDIKQNAYYGLMISIERWFNMTYEERLKHPTFDAYAYIWVVKYIKEYIDENQSILTYGIKQIKDIYNKNSCDYSEMDNQEYNLDIESQYSLDNVDGLGYMEDVSNKLFSVLDETEKRYLFAYYGIISGESLSYDKIAELVGEDKVTVHNIIKRAIQKVKEYVNSNDNMVKVFESFTTSDLLFK